MSRPGRLARRTVGLPASQPGPVRRRIHESARDPEAAATCTFANGSKRPLPCGVFMAGCGCRQMQSQVPRFSSGFHGYITLKKKKVLLAGLPWLQLFADPAKKSLDFSTSPPSNFSSQKCRKVWCLAADAAVRRPSVGLSAVAGSQQQQARRWGLRPHRVLCGAGRSRRCCTQTAETAPKKAAKRQHRPGKGWGAVAAPFNSLLHTPRDPS